MKPDELSYEEKVLLKRELNRLIQLRDEIHHLQSPYLPLLNSQIELLESVLEESEEHIEGI